MAPAGAGSAVLAEAVRHFVTFALLLVSGRLADLSWNGSP
jgi:hypothetical protein